MLAVARVVGWSADWQTLRSRPTLARLIERTGLAERTVQRWLRWLEARGLLEVIEPGTTPQFRPGVLHASDPNLAREWVLTRPPNSAVNETGTPSQVLVFNNAFPLSDASAPSHPRAPARETSAPNRPSHQDQQDRRSAPDCSFRPSPLHPAPTWPLNRNPHRRAEQLAAAESLRRDHLVLRRIPARVLRRELRPYFAAACQADDGSRSSGWTPGDVLHAIEYLPDGTQHQHADRVREPAAWLRHRLSFWLDASGAPLPPHSAILAQRAEQARAERPAAQPRRPGGPPQAYLDARAALAARLAAAKSHRVTAQPRPPLVTRFVVARTPPVGPSKDGRASPG